MRDENQRQHAETRAQFSLQFSQVLETVLAISKAVNAMHADLRDLRRGQSIIETELRGLRGRVERLEDRQSPEA